MLGYSCIVQPRFMQALIRTGAAGSGVGVSLPAPRCLRTLPLGQPTQHGRPCARAWQAPPPAAAPRLSGEVKMLHISLPEAHAAAGALAVPRVCGRRVGQQGESSSQMPRRPRRIWPLQSARATLPRHQAALHSQSAKTRSLSLTHGPPTPTPQRAHPGCAGCTPGRTCASTL